MNWTGQHTHTYWKQCLESVFKFLSHVVWNQVNQIEGDLKIVILIIKKSIVDFFKRVLFEFNYFGKKSSKLMWKKL